MSTKTRAKVFTHGGSQAVRLPKDLRFDVAEVEVWREGDTVHMRAPCRDTARMWREIDARRGEEILPYPPQAVLEEPPDFGA